MDKRSGQGKRGIGATASVVKAALFPAVMLAVIAVIVVIGCSGEASETSGLPVEGPTAGDAASGASGASGASSGESSEDSDDGGQGGGASGASGASLGESSEDSDDGDDSDAGDSSEGTGDGDGGDKDEDSEDSGTVSMENPNPSGAGPTLDRTANKALADAEPLNIITWTTPPTIAPGEISGEGTAEGGANLFNPQFEEGDGAAFEVYYAGHEDPMVVLLPDLGPMEIWNTFETVATMEWEMEGGKFSFRAYSPLFMDADPSALELRVYGYDGDGNAALLAVSEIVGE